MIAKKAPNPIDRHVGSRVRMRRMMLGMSQEKLGDALGITFQQIQKYEKGANRIGASRLQHISEVLQVPAAFFFEGAPSLPEARTPKNATASPDTFMDLMSHCANKESLDKRPRLNCRPSASRLQSGGICSRWIGRRRARMALRKPLKQRESSLRRTTRKSRCRYTIASIRRIN